MINVIIVEDKDFIREGLELLLNSNEGFNCIGAFPSCEEMLANVEELIPDIILMDLGLPGMSGIEGTKKVKKILPSTNVIVFTIHEESDKVFEALISGASGYLIKTTPHEEILLSIKDAYDGGSPMNSNIAKKMVELLRAINEDKKEKEELLSERENEVLTALAQGKGYKQIAETLFISSHTVRYHIRNIYEKFNVNTQTAAIAIAIKKGLI
ncbi:MAG: response regulator transcription factor [Ignavibacteriales bacterium]|nr:response regulator transcription factor [Ignavibacteriales bacterium]MCB9207792.1 response regulator transcription factor [Ignavibacteriales bacterium]MCB9258562.1 response regulator transcription factor [Ignavibacteriales bacterium]